MKKGIKIGLDFHGVITDNPKFFSKLSKILVDSGNEVHIISGSHANEITEELEKYGISYTHVFSILDHHILIGTEMQLDKYSKKNTWVPNHLWNKTKAEYCKKKGIDLHIDDSDSYGTFFKTPYAAFTAGRQAKQKRK